MSTLQTIFLVISGYLASRLLVRLELHVRAVSWMVRRGRRHPAFMLLAMMSGCAGLSLVLPNALTVLAVLPLIEIVVIQVKKKEGFGPKEKGGPLTIGATTAMTLAVIYGANIGGTGSLLGSPANLYLILTMEVLGFPGRESVHFVSWLVFGLPVALVLTLAAWGVLTAFTPRPVLDALAGVSFERGASGFSRSFVARASTVLVVVAVAHVVVLTLAGLLTENELFKFTVFGRNVKVKAGDVAAFGLTALTTVVLITVRMRPKGKGTPREPLLRTQDLAGHLPWRGLALALGAVVFLVIVAKLGGGKLLERFAAQVVPKGHGGFLFIMVLTAVSLFATEVLNNTTTATLLFPMVLILSKPMDMNPVPVAVAVSMASTCAFMTPVATPVNALAFGAFKGVRLRTMLAAGALVNTVSALVIGVWAYTALPRILAFFS